MIAAQTVPPQKLTLTTRLLCQEVLRRGWKAELYYTGRTLLRLQRPDGKVLEVLSATPPTTSYIAAELSDDKFATHLILEEQGLPLAITHLATNTEEAFRFGAQLLANGQSVVIKPHNGAHGQGITVGVQSQQALHDAIRYAETYATEPLLIVQESIEDAIDVRLTCIGYTFVAALQRIPARVQGDGHHTVKELIELENRKDTRGTNYLKPLNVIDAARAAVYLGHDVERVPGDQEWVQVLGTANVGTGGETVDLTRQLPQWLTAMAERAAVATRLPVCGIDFLLRALPTPNATEAELQPVIIETNKGPALFMHETPTHGAPQPVIAKYVDYLESIA